MTMPFFIQTRDSMPIIKGSLVEALRMGGVLRSARDFRPHGLPIVGAKLLSCDATTERRLDACAVNRIDLLIPRQPIADLLRQSVDHSCECSLGTGERNRRAQRRTMFELNKGHGSVIRSRKVA